MRSVFLTIVLVVFVSCTEAKEEPILIIPYDRPMMGGMSMVGQVEPSVQPVCECICRCGPERI